MITKNGFGLVKRLALKVHILHERFYSYFKLKKSNLSYINGLNFAETNFVLELEAILHQFSNKPIVIYDIGAACGEFSSALSKVRSVVKIHAFEPQPDSYFKLKEKLKANQKVQAHNIALGQTYSKLDMYINNWSNSSSLLPLAKETNEIINGIETQHKIEVEVFPLDDYVETNNLALPNIIKIDVQGFEYEILKSGKNCIRHAEYCILELSFKTLYENSPLFDDLYQFMRDNNFQLIGTNKPMIGPDGTWLQVDGIFRNMNL